MVSHIMEGLSSDAGESLERNSLSFFLLLSFVLDGKRS